jgi:hypothetical protein
MGWAARRKFKGNYDPQQCSKCHGTGIRGYSINPFTMKRSPIKCKCVILKEIKLKELDDLAQKAVDSLEKRKDEDVKEWAENLAADVADLND